jgi:hypothetical protein
MESIERLAQLMRRIGHRPVNLDDDLGFEVLLPCQVCTRIFYIWTRRTRGDVFMTDGVILSGVDDEIPLTKMKKYMCDRFEIMK